MDDMNGLAGTSLDENPSRGEHESAGDSSNNSSNDLNKRINNETNNGAGNQEFKIEEKLNRLTKKISSYDNERLDILSSVTSINQELSYFRHIIDFQNQKIEKLTSLISDIFENKDPLYIINSLQSIQDSNDNVNVGNNVEPVDTTINVPDDNDNGDKVTTDNDIELTNADVAANLANATASVNSNQSKHISSHLDSNMDPALHVAQAAVQAQNYHQQQSQSQQPQQNQPSQHQASNQQIARQQEKKITKRTFSDGFDNRKANSSPPLRQQKNKPSQDASPSSGILTNSESATPTASTRRAKKPKISVEFLHNPMTVNEIYDEFNKGFRGQIPLKDMDDRYGKHEWRGDSRSKESKRFQRRKKLCDAIDRGCVRFNQSPEEIIRRIEEFRGDKSLTWIMNGNLPAELE